MIAFTGAELLEWVEHTSQGWRRLIGAHPEVLAFPCDIRETKSVAELLQHIVAVELRYAERLNDQPETAYDSIPFDSAAAQRSRDGARAAIARSRRAVLGS